MLRDMHELRKKKKKTSYWHSRTLVRHKTVGRVGYETLGVGDFNLLSPLNVFPEGPVVLTMGDCT